MIKFYTQEQIEKDGFQQIIFRYRDENNAITDEQLIDVWFKDILTGRKLFIKCSGCNRLYDGGIVSKTETHVGGMSCPFCQVRINRLMLRK